MSEDPNVVWLQTDPAGILYKAAPDPAQDAWHAGHVNDVIALDDGGILIATDSGGVWSVAANGTTLPLTDNQDNPDTTCLSFGPFGPRHIYAGTRHDLWGAADSLYETDPTAIEPLRSWRSVPLPSGVGTIYRVGVLKASRRIALACDGGVYWSPIPSPGGPYNWKQVFGIPAVSYRGLAVGDRESVAVAAMGTAWDSWLNIPAGFVQFPPGNTVSVVARDANHIEIFAIDILGGIYSARWDATSPGPLPKTGFASAAFRIPPQGRWWPPFRVTPAMWTSSWCAAMASTPRGGTKSSQDLWRATGNAGLPSAVLRTLLPQVRQSPPSRVTSIMWTSLLSEPTLAVESSESTAPVGMRPHPAR